MDILQVVVVVVVAAVMMAAVLLVVVILTEDKGSRGRGLSSHPSPYGHDEYHDDVESYTAVAHEGESNFAKGVHQTCYGQHLWEG